MHEGHNHHHEHEGGAASREEALALLNFTLAHNRSHEEELHNLAHTLEQLHLDTAAHEVWHSLDDSKCASEHIERAIAAINA